MLVTNETFSQAIAELKSESFISLDTETTGLYAYQGDRLFAIICSNSHDTYYFNFNDNSYSDKGVALDRALLARGFSDLLGDETRLVYLANAKFDMHMLAVEGIAFKAKPWDVLSIAKCINNSFMTYSLESVAKRAGYEKLSTVDDYITKHGLYDKVKVEGKKTEKKNLRFDRVPLDVMQIYAERDAEITYKIGNQQQLDVGEIELQTQRLRQPSFSALIEREIETTRVCFDIERLGMKINEEFIKRAIEHESGREIQATFLFKEMSGKEFVDSNKALRSAFEGLGFSGKRTKKGNPSFDKKAIASIAHPLAANVLEVRDAKKRANTYFKSFLSFADENGIVHPNIRQTGPRTFRFSITSPALQTVEKPDEDSEVSIPDEMRNSFIARDGFFLVSIDYQQQEYRLTADYAGQMDLIDQINKGSDVHTATASLMGVTRTQAKTLNFMLLYGGGVVQLCLALMKPKSSEMQLKAITKQYIYKTQFKEKHLELLEALEFVTEEMLAHDLPLLIEAHALQQKYFSSIDRIKRFMDRVQYEVKNKGYIYNFAGRRLYLYQHFAYKGPNHLIQSSGAEIMRIALIKISKFLSPHQSKMLLSLHDEILLEMPEKEYYLIPQIRQLMVDSYAPINGCFMGTDCKVGKTWGNMKKYG